MVVFSLPRGNGEVRFDVDEVILELVKLGDGLVDVLHLSPNGLVEPFLEVITRASVGLLDQLADFR